MRFLDDIAPMLAISANERVKQTPVRMLLAGLIGWILYSSGMNALLPAWIAWALLVQAFELLAMGPFRRARTARTAAAARSRP